MAIVVDSGASAVGAVFRGSCSHGSEAVGVESFCSVGNGKVAGATGVFAADAGDTVVTGVATVAGDAVIAVFTTIAAATITTIAASTIFTTTPVNTITPVTPANSISPTPTLPIISNTPRIPRIERAATPVHDERGRYRHDGTASPAAPGSHAAQRGDVEEDMR